LGDTQYGSSDSAGVDDMTGPMLARCNRSTASFVRVIIPRMHRKARAHCENRSRLPVVTCKAHCRAQLAANEQVGRKAVHDEEVAATAVHVEVCHCEISSIRSSFFQTQKLSARDASKRQRVFAGMNVGSFHIARAFTDAELCVRNLVNIVNKVSADGQFACHSVAPLKPLLMIGHRHLLAIVKGWRAFERCKRMHKVPIEGTFVQFSLTVDPLYDSACLHEALYDVIDIL